jgi:hypothetical protein
MSIDKIGRRGAPAAGSATKPAVAPSGATFQVQGPAALTATNAPGPLDRLRSGTIDQAGYVEEHVEQATEHLHGLGAETMEHVRETLRDACESSPLLSELVARASR